MHDAIRRYATLLVACLLTGMIGGHAASWIRSVRASAGPLLSTAESPLLALLAVAVALTLITVIALASARLVNSAVALFVLGWGIGVMAMRSGTVVDLAFIGPVAPMRIGLETLLWAVLVAAASAVIWRVGGPLLDMPRPDAQHNGDAHNGIVSALRGPHALRGLAATIVAIPVVMLLARTMMTGQALGAAVVGGMVAGALARWLSPRAQPVFVAPAAILLLGAAQCIAAMRLNVPLEIGVVTGSVPRLLRVMPIELAAGVIAGVALGIGWSRSFATLAPEERESPSGEVAKPLRSVRTA